RCRGNPAGRARAATQAPLDLPPRSRGLGLAGGRGARRHREHRDGDLPGHQRQRRLRAGAPRAAERGLCGDRGHLHEFPGPCAALPDGHPAPRRVVARLDDPLCRGKGAGGLRPRVQRRARRAGLQRAGRRGARLRRHDVPRPRRRGTDGHGVNGPALDLLLQAIPVAFIMFVVLNFGGLLTWVERKQSAIMQDRIGANRASIFGIRILGLLHPLADAVKMLTKEDFMPAHADRMLFKLAPFVSVFFALAQGLPLLPQYFGPWIPAWGILTQPLAFFLFLTAGMAATKRIPFDMPEGESEIIGYFIEYSGMKFGMFAMADFLETVVIAGMTTALFLGGWQVPYLQASGFV